jgi:hypothetical protein
MGGVAVEGLCGLHSEGCPMPAYADTWAQMCKEDLRIRAFPQLVVVATA